MGTEQTMLLHLLCAAFLATVSSQNAQGVYNTYKDRSCKTTKGGDFIDFVSGACIAKQFKITCESTSNKSPWTLQAFDADNSRTACEQQVDSTLKGVGNACTKNAEEYVIVDCSSSPLHTSSWAALVTLLVVVVW